MTSVKSTKLSPLEFRLHRLLSRANLADSAWLLACSGGLDSAVLVHAMAQVAPRLRLRLEIAYVHHGVSEDVAVASYRNEAQIHVQDFASQLGLPFVALADSGVEPKSEAELRTLRRRLLTKAAGLRGVVFAHHADDLLETRLLRLIRGTGAQGLKAMRIFDKRSHQLRPLLKEPRCELAAYASEQGLGWLEDPSNESLEPLRNWVRKVWLPQLEERKPGGASRMARSLDLVVQAGEIAVNEANEIIEASGVNGAEAKLVQLDHDFATYLAVGDAEQRRQIAALLLEKKGASFTETQILEIQKRLNRGLFRREFAVAGVVWKIERSAKWQLTTTPVESIQTTLGSPNEIVFEFSQ